MSRGLKYRGGKAFRGPVKDGCNRTKIPVYTVPEQLLKRSKNLSGTV